MSRRSILLASTVCIALGASAAIEQASAHGGGGGGGIHSADAPSMSRMPSRTASPAEHPATIAHTKAMPEEAAKLARHKVFKGGNGVTPLGASPDQYIRPSKPAITPAVNLPPQVATQSVPPTPVKVGAGALATKPVVPSAAFPPANPPANSPIGPAPTVTTPGNPVGNGVPPSPIKAGTIVGKPGVNTNGLPEFKVIEPGGTSVGTEKPGTLADKPTITPRAFPGMAVLQVPPTPPPPSQAPSAPSQTPPTPMIPGFGGGGVVIAGDVDLTDADRTCYWIKRKLLKPDGEVIGRVKVCEVTDADQP
jgi:hypothetical protein